MLNSSTVATSSQVHMTTASVVSKLGN